MILNKRQTDIINFIHKSNSKTVSYFELFSEFPACGIDLRDLVESKVINYEDDYPNGFYSINKNHEIIQKICFNKSECECGAKYTSNPKHHLFYCKLSK